MGCCFSSSAGPNSPYPGGAPSASARHINPPSLSLPEGAQPADHRASAHASPRRRRRDAGPLDQHINKPLRRHEWTSRDRRWTRRHLDAERADFFDTRVTGRSQVWQTVHAALEVLWQPPAPDADADDGLATAQSILAAAEISLPTGDLANGVYDSLGNYYQLPHWVVADPSNLASGAHDDDSKGDLSTAGDDTVGDDYDDDDDEDDDDDDDDDDDEHGGYADGDVDSAVDDAQRRREEKGKAVLDLRNQVTLRARLSETGRDIDVSVAKSDSVRSIVRTISSESALPSSKKIRLAYMGKMLKDNSSLEAQGWQIGHVVNAFIFHR